MNVDSPLYIEFYLEGRLYASRCGCGGTHNRADAAPRVGDEVLLNPGDSTFLVTNAIWDFVSQDTTRQGLRLVIVPREGGE